MKRTIYNIAINFGDNDFYSTFQGLLSFFLKLQTESPINQAYTKEEVCFLLNELLFPMYLSYQHHFRGELDPEEFTHMKTILKLTPDQIYLNEEATEYTQQLNISGEGNKEVYCINNSSRACYAI